MKRTCLALPSLLAPLLYLASAIPVAAQSQHAAQNHGLWIGSIPACAGTVASVTVEINEAVGDPEAIVTFRPAWRAALLRETTRLLNRPMPVRLDGRVLMAPIVREPIAGGRISISPDVPPQIERMRAAAARPCPRGVRQRP